MIRDQVFISYCHEDERFLNELRTQLKPYLRKDAFRAWSDKQLEPGSKWFETIKTALSQASVAVMLVSPGFLASDFIDEHELGPMLKEAEAGGVKILWVLIRDCAYNETRLKDYQAVVSPPGVPFAAMKPAKRDTAWRKVCEAIKQAVSRPPRGVSDAGGTAPDPQQKTAVVAPKQQHPHSESVHSDAPVVVRSTHAAVAGQTLKVIFPLHGIRTLAAWQRGLSDLVDRYGWTCRLDQWSYGRFSLLAFLTPWTREAKLRWLRRQYDSEIHNSRLDIERGQIPSVVAHSFGTYILGYALLRFDFIRFNKVILCGSILPRDFPWDKLIERGQVQAVRNEFGVRDPWVKRVRCLVRGTGASGASRFTCNHERLEQEEFEYDHGDYFGLDHMEDRWIPFLEKPFLEIRRSELRSRIPRPRSSAPWCLYGLLLVALVVFVVPIAFVSHHWQSGLKPAAKSFNQVRSDVLASYTDQIVDNLIRVSQAMRPIQLEFDESTGEIAKQSRDGQVYDAYLEYLTLPGSFKTSDVRPAPDVVHIMRYQDGKYFWVPREHKYDFLMLFLYTIVQDGRAPTDTAVAMGDTNRSRRAPATLPANHSDSEQRNWLRLIEISSWIISFGRVRRCRLFSLTSTIPAAELRSSCTTGQFTRHTCST